MRFPLYSVILLAAALTSCISDGISTSPSDQPRFSAETVDLGLIFPETSSSTSAFKVYNPHDKGISIAEIALAGGEGSPFRLNVDGLAGRRFTDVEVRGGDSLYVFVEATLPASSSFDGADYTDKVTFSTNGVTTAVELTARSLPVETLRSHTVTGATVWDSHPRRIFGELVIAEGASLTIKEGVTLYMHADSRITAHGALKIEGGADSDDPQTPSRMVTLRGDRLDQVVGTSAFDLLAGQWGGMTLHPGAAHSIAHADIRGTSDGLTLASGATLTLVNSRLHRSQANVLTVADGATLEAAGCELSDSRGHLLEVGAAAATLTNCSLVNYYISSYDVASLLAVTDAAAAVELRNSLLLNYRNTNYVDSGDGHPVFRRCMFPVDGTDDEDYHNTLWGASVVTRINTEDHIYDYRLAEESDGRDSGDPSLLSPLSVADLYGVERPAGAPAIGAYQ